MDVQAAKPTWKEALGEMRTFVVLWFGQLVSMLGSGLTGFAIPVWVYERTGSAEQFGLLMFSGIVPGIVLSPFAGALVDRWDRRKVLIFSDTAAAVMTLAIAALVFTGNFEVWHLFIITAIGSSVGAFQDPAFAASIQMLVPRHHYGRAIGMNQTSMSLATILTPLMAGFLVVTIGLAGILVIDFATFLVAIATLAAIRIPNPPRAETPPGSKRSLLRDAADGWRYIATRRGLAGLLVFFAVINFWGGFVNPLVQPMILAFTTPKVMGTIITVLGVGSLLGALMMSTWGGPKHRVRGIIGTAMIGGLCIAVMGLKPWVPLIAGALFVFAFTTPILTGSSSAIWMSKTPPEMLGRVFAVRRMIAVSVMPLAILLAGPLAERVFEPLLMPGGALAGTLGTVMGVGPGRGIGLMYLILGGLMVVTSLAAYMVPAIRHVERDLPDAPRPEPRMPPPPRADAPPAPSEPAAARA